MSDKRILKLDSQSGVSAVDFSHHDTITHLITLVQNKHLNFFLSWMCIYIQNNHTDTSTGFGDIDDQRFSQSDWLRTFEAITWEGEFFQMWDF